MSKLIVANTPISPPAGYTPIVPEQFYDSDMPKVFIFDPETAYLRMGKCACNTKTWLVKFIKLNPQADIALVTRRNSELIEWIRSAHPDWEIENR